MDNKTISSWIRQARYRAKRQDIYSDLEIQDIVEILADQNNKCAYCQCGEPDTLDHPFPLKDHAPNIPANVVPVCKQCKQAKKNHDLIGMFTSGFITEARYIELLGQLFSKRGGDIIKEYVRRLTGHSDGQN